MALTIFDWRFTIYTVISEQPRGSAAAARPSNPKPAPRRTAKSSV